VAGGTVGPACRRTQSCPLPGSAVLTSVSRVEGSQATQTETGLTGYVVQLRLDDVLA